MRRFAGLVWKEFLHIFRDRRTLLVLFGIPVAQILIFGFVITNDFKDIGVSVMDQSGDATTNKIISRIYSSGYFQYTGGIYSQDEIPAAFETGMVRAVIIFGPQFGSELETGQQPEIKIITDASDPNLANTIVNYLMGIVQSYQADLIQGSSQMLMIEPQIRMVYNENLVGAYMFVPGTMALILMLISALLTSISITREKELGTLEVLLVSPLKPIQIILGKVMPYIFLAFINGLIILVIGHTVFGLPVHGNYLLLLMELLLYILLALSLGILISSIAPTQQIAMFVSLFALMLPTVLLSGFIYPIENMPVILQWFSMAMPPRWFIIILKDIMLKGNGLADVWDETLILFGMTVLFLVLSIKKFKVRLG